MAQVFKGAGTKIAKLPGIQPELDAAAAKIKARAAAAIASSAQNPTGSYAASLKVIPARGRNGVRDRLVVADDPAAVHIEYGHLARGANGGTWVPGEFPLTRAVGGGA